MSLWKGPVLAMAFALTPSACAHEKQYRWTPAALEDLAQVAEATAPEHGLPSERIAASEIRALLQQGKRNPEAAAQLQATADALYARLARSFAQGRTDPAEVDPRWRIPRASIGAAELDWASAGKNSLPSESLIPLLPTSSEYQALQQEYVRVLDEPEGAAGAGGRTREQRITSLRASLERWRWLPRGLGPLRVEARIPQFEVVLQSAGAAPSVFNAIVGAARTQTPSFAAEIDGVILNPTWTPPNSILVNELLPQMRRDPAARAGYDVIDSRGRVVDPGAVDWSARPFPYQLRQPAGSSNALGRLKFVMPNPYDVYLHDTPSRGLFAREQRALSHGCIRVERPVELAAALLQPAWTLETLESAIAEGGTQTIDLAGPVPFYALYITASAWDGVVRYGEDIYQRDAAVIAALDAPPEQAPAAAIAAAVAPERCPA